MTLIARSWVIGFGNAAQPTKPGVTSPINQKVEPVPSSGRMSGDVFVRSQPQAGQQENPFAAFQSSKPQSNAQNPSPFNNNANQTEQNQPKQQEQAPQQRVVFPPMDLLEQLKRIRNQLGQLAKQKAVMEQKQVFAKPSETGITKKTEKEKGTIHQQEGQLMGMLKKVLSLHGSRPSFSRSRAEKRNVRMQIETMPR